MRTLRVALVAIAGIVTSALIAGAHSVAVSSNDGELMHIRDFEGRLIRPIAIRGRTFLFHLLSDDGRGTREIWASDGTRSGTTRLWSFQRRRPADKNEMCSSGIHPRSRLWISSVDAGLIVSRCGASETAMLRTASAEPAFADAHHLDGSAYLLVDGELWTSDGTEGGTRRLTTLETEDWTQCRVVHTAWLASVERRAFFMADDGTHGCELWVTDGTPTGTRMVQNIGPGKSPGLRWEPGVAALGDVIYLLRTRRAPGPGGRGELWRTDGTDDGTSLVRAFDRFDSWRPSRIETLGADIFFAADDGTNGLELWRSDGTVAGTAMVKDINPRGDGWMNGPNPLCASGAGLIFVAWDGEGPARPWVTDGTETGTRPLRTIVDPTGDPQPVTSLLVSDGHRVIISTAVSGSHQVSLWASDGTEAGTRMLARWPLRELWQGAIVGDTLFMADDGPDTDPRTGSLWVMDLPTSRRTESRAARSDAASVEYRSNDFVRCDSIAAR